MTLVWKIELHSTDKFVLMYYADRASDDGTGIWPSIETVAKATGFSERTVQKATKKLIHSGYLSQVGWTKYGTKLLKVNTRYLSEIAKESESVAKGGEFWDMERRNKISRKGKEIHQRGELDAPKPSITTNKPSINKEKEIDFSVDSRTKKGVDMDMKRLLRNAYEKNHTIQ